MICSPLERFLSFAPLLHAAYRILTDEDASLTILNIALNLKLKHKRSINYTAGQNLRCVHKHNLKRGGRNSAALASKCLITPRLKSSSDDHRCQSVNLYQKDDVRCEGFD